MGIAAWPAAAHPNKKEQDRLRCFEARGQVQTWSLENQIVSKEISRA
jgi:hypothetical protein